jgi:hypothetical protein
MLEFLNNKDYFSCDKKYNGDFTGVVTGFNKKSNELIIKGEDDSGEKIIEKNMFNENTSDTRITQDINEYKNWENKLYNKLKNDGITEINVLSTESDDNWGIKIYRKETKFNHTNSENEGQVTLVNYVIIVEEDVVGEILSFQKKSKQDEKKKFTKWINDQIDNVEQFNIKEAGYDYMDAITICNAFSSDKEINLIWDMFWDEYFTEPELTVTE